MNIENIEADLKKAFEEDSELKLLEVLKNNSILFYELYSRKYGIQPNFKEVSFGGNYRCDFAWLNDNSDGPEWVLVEIEKPQMKLFNSNFEPSAELNHAIEQVKSWDRYFKQNPGESRRIFGAVSKFRYILVAGSESDWKKEYAIRWRAYHNGDSKIEIRSTSIFTRAIEVFKKHPEEFWSFEENPISLNPKELTKYWENYDYMNLWRKMLS